MAGTKYDLTAKVAPFLDPMLLRKIQEFNGESVAAFASEVPSAGSHASLENAQKLYNSGKFVEASKMLSELKFDPSTEDHDAQVWGKFAADLMAFPDAPKSLSAKASETKPAEGADEEATNAEEESGARADASSSGVEEEVDPVLKALVGVQELLDQRRSSDSTTQLNRRAWLIHWSLFAYFNGRISKLVDTFFTSQYMSVIQAACPWVLRYVVVAVVATHSRSIRFNRRVKDVIRVVLQELYEYDDPVLDFVKALYIDYDFANVASKLDAAAKLLANDYFAHGVVDLFVDNARVLIANSYLRVHEYVQVSDAAKVLGLSEGDEAKKWISEYIMSKQEAKLDAVYDESKGTVRVTYTKPSLNSQILEKVKAMDQRAYQLQQSQAKKTEA